MRGYSAIGLCHPKDKANVGSALRACGCFGASFLAYSGRRYQRHATDTQKAYRTMPLLYAGDAPEDILRVIPYDCVPIAVELVEGARTLSAFTHPERAYYIFGPEDSSLSKTILQKCQHTLVIPSNFCLNLAAAVNVVLYDRVSKRQELQKL